MAFAKVVGKLVGCPLHYWVHFELANYFGINEPLNEKTGEKIFEECNRQIAQGNFGARDIIVKSNCKALCTTDDPTSNLEYHKKLKEEENRFVMLPTYRADRALNIDLNTFIPFINEIEVSEGIKVEGIDSLVEALKHSLNRFKEVGCVVSDHGLLKIRYCEASKQETNEILLKKLNNEKLSEEEIAKYQTYLFKALAKMYKDNNVVMQLHIGAIRNNNTTVFNKLGGDCGIDSIGDPISVANVNGLLNSMLSEDGLPKTIIYPINPTDYTALSTACINFNCGLSSNYVAFGNAWWFNDSIRGIKNQLTEVMESGQLPYFIGMLTDSRSFTSFSRHDFFRRILCNLIGEYVENGEFPFDEDILGEMVKDICYRNAEKYFEL